MGLLDKNRLHLKGKRQPICIEKQWLTLAKQAVDQVPEENFLPATKSLIQFLEAEQATWEEQLQALKNIEKQLSKATLKNYDAEQIAAQIDSPIVTIFMQLYFSSTEVISQRHCVPTIEACRGLSRKDYVDELFSQQYLRYIEGDRYYQQSYANKANTIYAIMDFPLGAKVVGENLEATFYYLSDCLRETLSEIERTSFSDTQVLALSDKVVDCNSLLKTILGLLSRHDPFFRTLFSTLNQEELEEEQKKTVNVYENTVNSCITMCTSDKYTREFGPLAAMALASLLDLVDSPERVASLIFKLFSGNKHNEPLLKNVHFKGYFDMLNEKSHSDFTELIIYRGFLANLRISTLVAGIHSNSIMFQKLIGFCDTSLESHMKALAFETLTMWFETAKAIYKDGALFQSTIQYMHELLANETQQHILSYVWNNWDDPVDLVQQKVKDLFETVLKVSELNNKSQDSPERHAQFLSDLVKRLMEMDWYRKVKYALLSTLLPQVGTSLLLEICPSLISKALLVFHNQVLSPRASHLIIAFIEQRKREVSINDNDIKLWLAPICQALSSDNDLLRKNVGHYLLDKVFKAHPDSFWLAVEGLQGMDPEFVVCPQFCMNAMISVIKAGKSLDLIDGHSFRIGPTRTSERKLSVDILLEAIHHGDLYLRIDVLGLLCQAQKVTAEVTKNEIDLLQEFLTLNMNHTSPEFRQKLYGHLTKFFIRVRGNLYSLWRTSQSKQKLLQKKPGNPALQTELDSLSEKINHLKELLVWLCDLSMASLYPGASFQRVSSALKLFELLIKYFGIDDAPLPNGSVQEHSDSLGLPFRLPLATVRNSKILVEALMNPFEANREMVRKILFLFPSPLPGIETTEHVQKLLWWGFEAMTSNRANQSNSGATVFRLIFSKYVEKLGFCLEVEEQQPEYSNLTGVPSIDFTIKLLNLLEKQLRSASQNLLHAAQNYPVHGTLMALMYIFQDINYSSPEIKDNAETWRQVHSRTLNLVNSVCFTVFDVLSNPSTENNTPVSLQEMESVNEDELPLDDESIGPKRQVILSYSWRAVKEASTLLSVLFSRVPLDDGNSNLPAIMEYEQVIQGGDLLRSLLTSIRHRGAFSAVYPGYIAVCSRLLTAPDSKHSAVPKSWLNENLKNIFSNSVSVTRRSAGIPLCILAIVSSEPADSTHLLNYTMREVFKIAREPPAAEANLNNDLPQVHAFNILRTMFSDAKQGANALPYVEEGFMLAISGFSSDCWAIRNCSVMLFSTLLQRTFGTKKTKDEHHSMNTLTGKEFFSRFPKLHPFLLKELKYSVEQMFKSKGLSASAVHPGLYPVLTLLSRLQPSVMDGQDSALTMSSFVPAVLECAGGCIYKTREMAARALVPLVVSNDLVKTIVHLWEDIDIQSQNKLHGRLVQLLFLLRGHLYHVANHEVRRNVITCVAELFRSKVKLLLGDNKCSITRAVFYDIISEFVFEPVWIQSDNTDQGQVELVAMAEEEFSDLRKNVLQYALEDVFARRVDSEVVDVGRYLVLKHASKIITMQAIVHGLDYAEMDVDGIIATLLNDSDYEVRLSTLQALARALEGSKSSEEYRLSKARLWLRLAQLIFAGEANLECFKIETKLLSHSNFIPVIIQAHSNKDISFNVREFWNHLMDMMSNTRSLTVVEYTLPLLGSLVNYMWLHQDEYELERTEVMEFSKIWSDYVGRYSDESMSVSLREAALASIQYFEKSLEARGTSNQDKAENAILIDIYCVLIRLLQDDDIDIRQESAELVSKIGGGWTSLNSERAAEICVRNAAELEPTSAQLMMAYLEILNGGKPFDTIIAEELSPNQTLFVTERPNIYKEDLIETQLVYQVLQETVSKLKEQEGIPPTLRGLILHQGSQAVAKLSRLIGSLERAKEQTRNFGPSGFTGHASIFLEVYRIATLILLAKQVSPEEDLLSELKTVLAQLEQYDLHPLLADLYLTTTGSVGSDVSKQTRASEDFFANNKRLFLISLP
ncbi:hypothetical protein K493DRAFT_306724 [Basidiobolus meristosporus CBS 931.73]|uniref:Uncharacterized protein n=1 Tax=Basidiobolus meristosporus CBS 931.73 TaxID=1314790 RepID=A0A1Y1XSP9_9FUNG|nr:hypothetical protein K493DRAFT_306724 [Basidiobolus meristosporus CBS 931.73]|eukprot:ORX88334.1 hypothetical protein K493DRAFT_306724 [Basidiobolus meristosporus CBS 931.73]